MLHARYASLFFPAAPIMLHHLIFRPFPPFLQNTHIQMLSFQPLESFDVLGCPMMTDTGITRLLSSPIIQSTLSRVSLAYCSALTDATVDAILELQKLEWVDLRDCERISIPAKSRLQKRLAHAQVGCS